MAATTQRFYGGWADGGVSRREEKVLMRWVYLAIIALFGVAILIFAFQNLDVVTMSFLGFRVRAPLAVVAIIVYVLGALTGGSLLALLRRSYEGTKRSLTES
jgi:uncharacterized integral membrane protein